ncbi:MAG: hypothetical protein MR441_04265 [Bacteroidales bacterium]|nr:hypothetical protein [Bacteroidales bacterium]
MASSSIVSSDSWNRRSKAELLKEKETDLFSYSKKLNEKLVLSGFCKDDNFY